eukprot:365608-Chlamydomonas_euryale.AAC.11
MTARAPQISAVLQREEPAPVARMPPVSTPTRGLPPTRGTTQWNCWRVKHTWAMLIWVSASCIRGVVVAACGAPTKDSSA